jgi:hypothetical protein
MSCFEILHSEGGREIWNVKSGVAKSKKVSINYGHPMVQEIRRNVHSLMEGVVEDYTNAEG